MTGYVRVYDYDTEVAPMSTETEIDERLRTGDERSCPFEANSHTLQAHDPCPVCGDLGTDEALDKPIHCVDLNNRLLMKEALLEITKLRAERGAAARDMRERAAMAVRNKLCTISWPPEDGDELIDTLMAVVRALPDAHPVIATDRVAGKAE